MIMGFPGEERYRILAERLGIGRQTTFTGGIRYEDAATYLALGDLAVSPKLSLTEGNGKLVNYMAMGLPVVTFDSIVSREILGDLGVYAPAGDWTALAIEMEQVLSDLPAARERGRHLRARAVSEHGWSASISVLLDVYRQALQKKERPASRDPIPAV
jgi:glycosyltransferase involved in cell wall biosynthesis